MCEIWICKIIMGPRILQNYYQGVSRLLWNEGSTEPKILFLQIEKISDGRLTMWRWFARDTPGLQQNWVIHQLSWNTLNNKIITVSVCYILKHVVISSPETYVCKIHEDLIPLTPFILRAERPYCRLPPVWQRMPSTPQYFTVLIHSTCLGRPRT